VALFEGNPIQLVGGVEDAILQNIVQFEIGLNLRVIEIVLRLTNLLGVIVPIVGSDLESTLLSVDHGLDVFCFLSSFAGCGRNDGIHKFESGLGSLGHLIFQFPSGKAGKSEQLRLLCANLRQPRNRVARVIGIAAFSAVPGALEDRLTSATIA